MATLQYLSNRQINEAIRGAAEKSVPVTITVRLEEGWASYHSRLLGLDAGHLLLELPQLEQGQPLHDFQPAERAGVSFKLKHHKHVFTGTVAGTEVTCLDDGAELPILRVCSPTKMHRMQRRAFFRAEVPPNRVVRASFWLGGREAEPAGTSPDRPVWSGRVLNLSAGGFQMQIAGNGQTSLEAGENVGVRLIFGAGRETVYADAQFRHVETVGTEMRVGFQFIGLAQTAEGRQALQMIGSKAGEYQRDNAARQRGH
jgi:c-di-GMP-binding flagellar brake protein YcgR